MFRDRICLITSLRLSLERVSTERLRCLRFQYGNRALDREHLHFSVGQLQKASPEFDTVSAVVRAAEGLRHFRACRLRLASSAVHLVSLLRDRSVLDHRARCLTEDPQGAVCYEKALNL